MKKNILLVLAAAIIAVAVWYFFAAKQQEAPAQTPNQNQQTAQNQNQEETQPITVAVYDCDSGKTITVSFYKGEDIPVEPGQPPTPTGKVKLVFGNGKTLELAQTLSADGGRYANADESFVFWDKGGTALILENGTEVNYKNCAIAGASE